MSDNLVTKPELRSIVAMPPSVNFASVPDGGIYSQTIRLSNTSNNRLKVTKVLASGEAVHVFGLGLPFQLEAGQTATFNVTYSPTPRGNAGGAIAVTNNRDVAPLLIPVSAAPETEKAALSVDINEVKFGGVTVGSKESRNLTLTNVGKKDVKISRVSVGNSAFSVERGSEATLAPEQSASVTVDFDPKEVASSTSTLSVVSDAPDSPMQIAVSGSGELPSDHSVVVRWDADPQAVNGYFVYRGSDPGGPYTKLNSSPSVQTEYADTGLAAGQTYYYVIRSVDSSNDEGDYSSEVVITVP
jgi:hypothetical protein